MTITGFKRFAASATAIVAAVTLSGCDVYDLPLPGGPKTGDNPIQVNVEFRDVLDLVPQSTVKVNDVTVGKVTDIELRGYTALVTMKLPGDLDLPDNSRAEIRQTSLLGEKFVSLSAPADASREKLSNGDTIGLANSGRNPEIEEVLSALGALLSGGGVGQLKLIAEELNTAMGGREDEVRSVIEQIRYFTGQLASNKSSIVGAIENLNRLAVQLRQQDGSIKLALDNIPAALTSIDKQRDDLVKLLGALSRLSNVGTKVIKASKSATINSLRDLAPILTEFAKAGQDLPKSLQVFLTYPFVDEAVGRDPQVARNLHMGDYTNLSIRMDLDLRNGLAGMPAVPDVLDACKSTPLSPVCELIPRDQLCSALPSNPLCDLLGGGGITSAPDLGGIVGGLTGGLTGGNKASNGTTSGGSGGLLGNLLGLGRAGLGPAWQSAAQDPFNLKANGFDPGVGTLLLQGLLESGATK